MNINNLEKPKVKSIIGLLLFLVILMAGTSSFAQGSFGKIVGKVMEKGTDMPLIGANVMIIGTNLGAATDRNGHFEIVGVPPGNYVLKARFMGYKEMTKKVRLLANKTAKVNFNLSVDVLGLHEVVVTGMGGSQIKEKLGVTVAKVPGGQIIGSDEVNVVDALAAKAPNVDVNTFSGEPGATAFIEIRGRNSISRTSPLFVVDGVPIDNSTRGVGTGGTGSGGTVQANRASDLNPDDIASVEILKGAAASAIYGSRAANGVVLITTKSGMPGKTQIHYKTSYSWDRVNRSVPLQRKYGQGDKGVFKKDYLRSWGPKLDPSTPTYDHSMEMFNETGHIEENNLSISGGNNLTTFFVSFGAINQNGPFVGNSDFYKKYSFRVKASQVITEKLKITGNLYYANVKAKYLNSRSNTGGITLGAWRTPPEFNNWPYWDPVTGLHRSYRYSTPTVLRKSRKYDNPYFSAFEKINNSAVGRTIGNLTLDYDPLDWINVTYTLGSDYSEDNRIRVNPVSSTANSGDGSMLRRNYIFHEVDNNLVATLNLQKYLKRISNSLSGTFMTGYNFNRREYHHLDATGDIFITPKYYQLENTVTRNSYEYEYLIQTESFFGQGTFDLFKQLYLTAALRNDGSSTFGANQRRHWFPKYSAAWEFTKFSLLPRIPYFNFGKLRMAYGEAGIQPAVYSTTTGFISGMRSGYWTGTLNAGMYDNVGGFYSSSIAPAEDLRPERTKEFEVGTNLGFLNSRLGLDLTYYKSRSEDVIFRVPLPPSTGYSTKTANGAVIENKGWEVDLNMSPVKRKLFSWDMGILWATNKNQCVSLKGSNMISYMSWSNIASVAAEGYAIGEFYGTDFIRFGRGINYTLKDGTTINIDKAYPNAPAGSLFLDEDGYPVGDTQFRFLGDPNPKWTSGIRNEFTFLGKIKLSAFLDIRHGGRVWNGTKGKLIGFGTHAETEKRGTTKKFDGYGPGAGKSVVLDQNWYKGNGSRVSSQFIEDASLVRLREVAIAYTLRHRFIKQMGLSDIDIRLSGRNLKLWTKYTGIDPETNLNMTGAKGMDYFNMPNTRSYVLTLRFNY